MSMFEQTADGDILITNNGFTTVSGDDEIVQRLRNRLRSFLAEWFLDLTLGVAYIQLVFEKATPASAIDTEIKNAILSVPGIVELRTFERLDLDIANRRLDVNFSVRTINGTTIRFTEAIP